MNLLLAIVSLAVFTAAAPPQGLSKRQGALTSPIPAQGQVECDGEPGRTYCFDEVVWGKENRKADLLQAKTTRRSFILTAKGNTPMTL
ncbi:hypothetical protein J4E86_006298 [Alternaria arbusti]|uniref:uncharacterized protein n=1 Tax=Alternaria arbusti TaxID=232088 RepID=UPI002220539B|nr:uncharacterized protein J4E86_006298 [Alternaria arbusti]KAI4954987.1 hypothetical protein J4E86_006298 [Alternaria arbusti]